MPSRQSEEAVIDDEAREDDERQYIHGPLSEEELDQKYPDRPRNHSKTFAFHELFISLFNPLNENKKKPPGPGISRAKLGRHGPGSLSPHEARRAIIERFISRWRKEVGDDFYPALRLIIPEKDRDRAMYGLKEKAIGKLLVKLMKIDKNSEDGYNLLNWKLPSQTAASRMAGDFAGRCFEVLSKRPLRTAIGDMRIAEVNELLDKLSAAQKEENQLPIFETFYKRMNPEELMWLIRIILRQMKVGATEKTFLDLWHPDGEALFNVSSSLRRVCWELRDPNTRLLGDETDITLMQCFQPQLAQFQMHSFQKMVDNMRPTEEDSEFWIEEKLDGERMQLHMVEDDSIPGGKRFGFWSRKAKDYTYLYGSGFEDESAALTRHIKSAFDPGVRNIILDGEMITWDPEADIMVPFGTLKTAAISEQRNPFQSGPRPLYRIFDILYLNDESLTRYTLRDRRKALERCITNVHRRMEIHEYVSAYNVDAIEPLLRKVVAEASEGLVLKNPRSIYRLNSRNDDWMKVKPEYMTEFGESLECVVIGGYYGSGHRGGRLSSFLCGLRIDQNQIQQGANPMKCQSFFKVGGGFKAEDYANIRHHTDGKWVEYDPKKPPSDFIELAGGSLQYERPDVWIKPSDSVVLSVKAASVAASESFRVGYTLRFPRFKHLRLDKEWASALSIQQFLDIKAHVDEKSKEKEFLVDSGRRIIKKAKKNITIAGSEDIKIPYTGPATETFSGLNFCILSDAVMPVKKKKAELEQLVKSNGGAIFQSPTATNDILCIADKKVVKVASLIKTGKTNIIRSRWIFDALRLSEAEAGRGKFLIPFEPLHMFHMIREDEDGIKASVDTFGDSYTRDLSAEEVRDVLENMPKLDERLDLKPSTISTQLKDLGHELEQYRGCLFRDLNVYQTSARNLQTSNTTPDLNTLRLKLSGNLIRFTGGRIVEDLSDSTITHVVVLGISGDALDKLRMTISERPRVPRIVGIEWIEDSWKEGTLLDEERYAVVK